jgi:hypothetical protein
MTTKLVVAIPTLSGMVSAWTMGSVMGLYPPSSFVEGLQHAELGANARLARALSVTLLDVWLWPWDIVRVRSRACRHFLEKTDADYLLFVDADVAFEPIIIRKMLDTGADVIGAAYPKRDIRWEGAYEAAKEGRHPEHGAYEYPISALSGAISQGDLLEVEALPMGCTLLSRKAVQTMTEHYAPLLTAHDTHPHDGGSTVMLFAMNFGPDAQGRDVLLGEDTLFCQRWRAMGGKVFLYIGDGAPAHHVGQHFYKGTQEGFVYSGSLK